VQLRVAQIDGRAGGIDVLLDWARASWQQAQDAEVRGRLRALVSGYLDVSE
jgi:hypothetical protein